MVSVPVFAALALIFWSFGDRLLRAMRLRIDDAPGRFALSVALSYGTLSLAIFVLALLRVVSLASCAALVVLMAALAFRDLRSNLAALAAALRKIDWRRVLLPRGSWQDRAAWLAGLIVLLGAVQALAPPTGIDTGRLHFAAAKLMVREQGLSTAPEIWFHRTGGFHLVYLFGMSLAGEGLAKLLAFGVGPVALLLASAASNRLRPGSGRAAAFIVAATPLFSSFVGYEFLELPVLMYLLASALALAIFRAEGGAGAAGCVGAFAGLALSVKVSAFPVVVLLPVLAQAALRARAWPALAAAAAGFAVTAGFWPLWNKTSVGSFLASGYVTLAPTSGDAPSLASGILGALASVATTSDYWSDSAGPLVTAAVAGVLILGGPPESRMPAALFGAAVLFYLGVISLIARYYFQFDAHARYLGPFLAGFGALAAAPLVVWAEKGPRILRIGVLAALFLPAAPLLVLKAGKAAVAAPAAFGIESRSHYLAKKIETFEACEVLNALPEKDVKVLFLAHRVYYLDREFLPMEFIQGCAGREDVVRRVREARVTHVLVEPGTVPGTWKIDIDAVFGSPPFREIRSWPWRQKDRVRLYAVERP